MYKNITEAYDKLGICYTINEPLSEHTTFRIGGPADVFVMPDCSDMLVEAIRVAKNNGAVYMVIGRGSNLVFADDGYRGVIISTQCLKSVSVEGNTITCACGATLTSVAIAARDNSLAGFSFAYGIPGFVGGAVFMNAGAYGGQISDVLVSSTYYDTENDVIGTFDAEDHIFGYRESIYKKNTHLVILSAEFKLADGDASAISAEMEDFMGRRRSKQPLEFPSAGSVFKRPEGYFAGKLVEDCGFKGKSIGGAVVSEKHAGFIVNKGGATSADLKALIKTIKDEVRSRYSVELVCEIIFVD